MDLESVRKRFGLSQITAAQLVNVPLRTFIRYEKDNEYGSALKRNMIVQTLIEKCEITDDKGIISVEFIKNELMRLFDGAYQNKIDFCYLFGSYAKGYANEKSDVDLCISTSLRGLDFAGLAESIRNILHKRVDLIRFSNLGDNLELINEIMKDGIKIYG